MTLQELYREIGGDYEQALQVLRVDKLLDKHIRKLPKNGVVEGLLSAGETKDPKTLFEAAHAVKGLCANLGLTELSKNASEIADEFREGSTRKLSDAEVSERIDRIRILYRKAADGIARYEAQ